MATPLPPRPKPNSTYVQSCAKKWHPLFIFLLKFYLWFSKIWASDISLKIVLKFAWNGKVLLQNISSSPILKNWQIMIRNIVTFWRNLAGQTSVQILKKYYRFIIFLKYQITQACILPNSVSTIVIFYTEILIGKVFSSETSGKIHNWTFQVKILV